jgi:hypothetical protein
VDQNTFVLLLQRIDTVKSDLDEVRDDVKALLRFKWQLMGGSIVASMIMSVFIAYFIQIFSK